MSTKYIYFVRHGETVFNIEHRIQGIVDSPLTKKGMEQAKRVGEYFIEKRISFDHAYASNLQRTVATLRLITDTPYEQLAELNERGFGTFEGQKTLTVPNLPWGDYYVPYGGEGDKEVLKRMNLALQKIIECPNSEMILIVSHGACLRTLMANWAGEIETKEMILPNCGIAKYSYQDGAFHFIERISLPTKE